MIKTRSVGVNWNRTTEFHTLSNGLAFQTGKGCEKGRAMVTCLATPRAHPTGSTCCGAIILLAILLASGCTVPTKAPVWLPDGSAIVMDDLYHDVARGTTHDFHRPAAFSKSWPHDLTFDVPRRRVISSQLDYLNGSFHIRLESAPLPNATGETVSATLNLERTAFQDGEYPLVDVHLSPDGESALLCTSREVAIYDWSRKTLIRVPQVRPPIGFARIFGVSPCVPTGVGFLAGKEEDGTGEPRPIVLVTWAGTVRPMAATGSPSTVGLMFEHIQRKASACRFLGTAAWNGPVLTLDYEGDRLEVDADRLQWTATAGGKLKKETAAQLPPALRDQMGRSQDLLGGRFQVVIRKQGDVQLTGAEDWTWRCGTEVVVRDLRNGSERLIDFMDSFPQSGFELLPSPDRRHVLVQCWMQQLLIPDAPKGYGILVDADGRTVAVLGMDREKWESELAERCYGRFDEVDHKAFGKGYLWHVPPRGYKAEFLAALNSGQGPIGKLRQTDYIDLSDLNSADLAESVPVLASFPNLRYVGCSAEPEMAEALSKLPSLGGIEGDFTDDFLRAMPVLPKLQRVHVDLESTITTAGLRSLQKQPELDELFLERFRSTIDFAELGRFPKLETLLIRSEYKVSPSLSGVAQASRLKQLTVISQRISSDDLAEIGRLTSLHRATLSGLSEEIESLEPLSNLKEVTHLVVYRRVAPQNEVSVAPCPLRPLGELERLQCLTLSGIPFDSQQAAALASLPKLQSIRLYVSTTSADEGIRKASMSVPKAAVEIRHGERRVIYFNGEQVARSGDR